MPSGFNYQEQSEKFADSVINKIQKIRDELSEHQLYKPHI